MQVYNLSHDVNSNVLINFSHMFQRFASSKGSLASAPQVLGLFLKIFHVLNNLILVDKVDMAEWARIVRSFRRSLHLLSYFLLQG